MTPAARVTAAELLAQSWWIWAKPLAGVDDAGDRWRRTGTGWEDPWGNRVDEPPEGLLPDLYDPGTVGYLLLVAERHLLCLSRGNEPESWTAAFAGDLGVVRTTGGFESTGEALAKLLLSTS